MRFRERDRAVQLDDRRRLQLSKRVVEGRDASPIGLLRRARSRMAGRDRRLYGVRAQRAAELLRALERRETPVNEELVPAPPVLVE